ncbi:MAG TPA: antibiotic biosynthesis monooxygenase [Puia sp.]|jgi:quinol monooxygenase YgiN|nr:antibiotic biosynthesis monooxygenase [Puia sp.]
MDKFIKLESVSVYFEPGIRSNWHRQPPGQILITAAGTRTGLPPFCLHELIREAINSTIASMLLPHRLFLILTACMLTFIFYGNVSAQEKSQKVRLAKLVIDSGQLDKYRGLLKEEIETSVRIEPGVLTLYAVSEKDNPTHITILEIYAGTNAYKSHLQTPQFLKYKAATKNMVKSLEMVETIPIVPEMKIK